MLSLGKGINEMKWNFSVNNDFNFKINSFTFFINVCFRNSLLHLINIDAVRPFTVGEIFYSLSKESKIRIKDMYSIFLSCEKSEYHYIFKSDDELHEFLKIYYFLKENHKKAHIVDEESSILFFNKKFKYQLILPHKGTEFKYMLRKAKIEKNKQTCK